jgi:hypothetical protein
MSLIAQLKTIPGPRGQRGKRYPLWLLMFLALLGSLCGYWGYRPLAKFCSKHQPALAQLLEWDSQTPLLPSYSTFRRLFLLVEAQAWVNVFNGWALCHAPQWTELNWAIDGKSIRCTSRGGQTAAQDFACLVSVYGPQAGVVQLALMFNRRESEIAVAKRLVQSVTVAPPWPNPCPSASAWMRYICKSAPWNYSNRGIAPMSLPSKPTKSSFTNGLNSSCNNRLPWLKRVSTKPSMDARLNETLASMPSMTISLSAGLEQG